MASVPRRTPAPKVTREQVSQRCRNRAHQPKAISAAQDEGDDVLDLGVVLGLDDLVALFLAVDLDRRAGGEVLVEHALRVGLALVFLGGRLERWPVLLGGDRMALHAAAFLRERLGGA